MIKTMLYGANGKISQLISKLADNHDSIQIVAGVDRSPTKKPNAFPTYKTPEEFEGEVDLIIDFSHPSYLDSLIHYSEETKVPVVIATTGFTDEEMMKIQALSQKVPVLYSSNMSLGINIVKNILKQYTKILSENFDIEVIEKHHNKKLDAPSGTAYLLANTMNEVLENSKNFVHGREGEQKRQPDDIGIHAVRGGTIAGEHTILFAGMDELVELKHTALSKEIFALGAMKAAMFLSQQAPGYYHMDDLFNL